MNPVVNEAPPGTPGGALVRSDASGTIIEVLTAFGAVPDLVGMKTTDRRTKILRTEEASPDGATQLISVDSPTVPLDSELRALVIDDEHLNREYYNALFSDLAWHVDAAEDSTQGIELFTDNWYDVVLVDVNLPDRNGYETVRKLRANDPDRAYMVLMSADPQMVESIRVADVGADLALVGPIAPGQLENLLRSRKSAATDPNNPSPPSRRRARTTSVLDLDRTEVDLADATPSISVFGGISVFDGSDWHAVPPGRHTELIAALASNEPQVLTTAAIGSVAWAESAPSSSSIYTGISRLRSWLSSVGCEHLVHSRSGGYAIGVESHAIDSGIFRRRVEALRIDDPPELFIEAARRTLDIVTGTPYAGCEGPAAISERTRLLEMQAVVEQRLAVANILSENYSEAIILARDLAKRERWRERAWAILGVGLYRAGRQREALETFRHARHMLIETVGVEPGPVLREAEQLILNQSEVLEDPDYVNGLPS